MSDREILLRWLATAAARLTWSRRMRELGRFACALVALYLVAEILETLGVPAPVLAALVPLLAIVALAVVALLAWRLARPTTLAQAAGAADTRAALKDELKSAHWFVQRAGRNALVELMVTRAAQTAQRLDIRRLFPLGVPRSMLAALALAIFTGALAWFSPRIALPVGYQSISRPAPAANGSAADRGLAQNEVEKTLGELALQDTARHDPNAWSQLEQITTELPSGAEKDAIRRAVAARDGRLVAQLLQALQSKHAAAAQPDPTVGPDDKQMPAGVAQSTPGERQRDKASQDGEGPRESAANASAGATARVRQQLGEQSREEKRPLQGQPMQGQVTQNNRLRAVSRNSASMREVAFGEGQAAEAGAQTSVAGVARGERTGRSRAGGSEGEHPQNNTTGDGDTQPVLGEQTMRLEAQLQKMRVEGSNERPETEEAFYAATQRQASGIGYDDIMTQWRTQREATIASSATPLSYREGVKRYFLIQHGKED
jgi:hypothetical protein